MKTYIVDSFTDQPFAGNPAGVCIVEAPMTESSMLDVACELGLSETAFLSPLDTQSRFGIRFFSPRMEIPLCGHATLASARILFADRALKEVTFVNVNNLELLATESDGEITLEFPCYNTRPADVPTPLLDALGLQEPVNVAYNAETNILLLEIADAGILAELAPDFSALIHSHQGINGVLVTAPSGTDEYDFHSRYFWPWSGTNEDPVTGGTHTFLTNYWSERLGKTRMRSFQSSQRTGFMTVELIGDKVAITSQAVIILRGELVAPT